jgi:hypothetical protein
LLSPLGGHLAVALPGQYTAFGMIGGFLDDDGIGASFSPAVATSMGKPGPLVGGLTTWTPVYDGTNGGVGGSSHGAPPTVLSTATVLAIRSCVLRARSLAASAYWANASERRMTYLL